jgi:hypothetical protein
MALHLFSGEHNSLTKYRDIQESEIRKLKAYCSYVSKRFQSQALLLNDTDPVRTSSMLDDLEDAIQVSGLDSDPREWA